MQQSMSMAWFSGASKATVVLLAIIICMEASGTEGVVNIQLVNGCPFPVFPAWIPNTNFPKLGDGGAALNNQWETTTITVPSYWSGRIWGRRECSPKGSAFKCNSGDCSNKFGCSTSGTPPATLVQFGSLNGGSGRPDVYSVSVLDGYNLPIRVYPTNPSCPSAGCISDVNESCPSDLQIRSSSGVLGCKSSCLAYGQCEWSLGIFRDSCPKAITSTSDQGFAYQCPSGSNYVVTFCPPPWSASHLVSLAMVA